MTVYKHSELTPSQLAAWEEESRGEWVILVAPSRAALVSNIAARFNLDSAAVVLDDCGSITVAGSIGLRWREVAGQFQAYFPAKGESNIVKGPW